jgi:hypothetical protein
MAHLAGQRPQDALRHNERVIKNNLLFVGQAKAAKDKTDSTGDIRQARKKPGHEPLAMTEHDVSKRRGDGVGQMR